MKANFTNFSVIVLVLISQQLEIPSPIDANPTNSTETTLKTTNETVSGTSETVSTTQILATPNTKLKTLQNANETHTYVSDTPSLKDIEELSKQFLDKSNNTDGNSAGKTDGNSDGNSEVADLNKNDLDMDLAKSLLTSTTFEVHEDLISVVKNSEDVGPSQSNENEDDREGKKALLEQLGKDQEIILDAGPLVKGPKNTGGNAAQLPVIVASIFVILCMIGYTALLMWRRHLERKYGNREMLVNEELDPNDMRHFSI